MNTNGDAKENRLIMTCDDKMKIHNHEFFFMKTWGFDDEFLPIFEKGKHYYFICKFLSHCNTAVKRQARESYDM